ncbi:Uncharacterized protein pbN1_20330 [Aromatoleum bremense]|nr:Uncharacterized protein pbN1_20330 [Aromatoleum bremense]
MEQSNFREPAWKEQGNEDRTNQPAMAGAIPIGHVPPDAWP